VLGAALAAGVVDEDAAHGLGRRGEEVAPAVPVLSPALADQPDVRFVDQGRGLERLAGRLVGQLQSRQFAQLVVDQRQQLAGRVGLAPRGGVQDLGDVAHTPSR
jgi:hypothetical protein